MCKLMCLTNVSKLKSIKKLVNEAKPIITKNDSHGFGWAMQGSKGVCGERMNELHHRYGLGAKINAMDLPGAGRPSYNSFGVSGTPTGAMLIHGRTSTNEKALKNVHPIVKHDWTLVHNGVVSNKGEPYAQITSNDTEHLVEYLGARDGIEGIQKNLAGYYAFAAIDPEGRLHVCRDDNATLYVSWIETIESFVYATTADLIYSLCSKMKWKHSAVESVMENIYMIFDGNKLVHQSNILPRGYDYVEAVHMGASLGREDENVSYMSDYGRQWSSKIDPVDEFLDACRDLDSSCSISDEFGTPLNLEEFRALDDISKLGCVIKLADGQIFACDELKNGTEM